MQSLTYYEYEIDEDLSATSPASGEIVSRRRSEGGDYVAHIVLDTVYELWESMEEHSWTGLRQALNEMYYDNSVDDNSGINASTIDTLVDMTRHLEYQANPFPNSAEQLYHVINANFGYEEDIRRGM